MKRLRPVDNEFAERARLDKAMKLAALIRDNYGPIDQHVLDALYTQPNRWWAALAKEAEVAEPPSPACVEAVVGLLSQEMAFEGSPLRGLR